VTYSSLQTRRARIPLASSAVVVLRYIEKRFGALQRVNFGNSWPSPGFQSEAWRGLLKQGVRNSVEIRRR